ncbi:hypothetical protein T484DRAFT_1774037, partial [Baffinella frigidus]
MSAGHAALLEEQLVSSNTRVLALEASAALAQSRAGLQNLKRHANAPGGSPVSGKPATPGTNHENTLFRGSPVSGTPATPGTARYTLGSSRARNRNLSGVLGSATDPRRDIGNSIIGSADRRTRGVGLSHRSPAGYRELRYWERRPPDAVESDLEKESVKRRGAEARLRDACGECPDVFARAGLKHLAPWPAWLSAVTLSAHPHLLPSVEVGETLQDSGVTHYAIEVTLDADSRGNWILMKRFSHLLEATYWQHAVALVKEKRRATLGRTSDETVVRRSKVARGYLRALLLIVEALASQPLRSFLDLDDRFLRIENVRTLVLAHAPSPSPAFLRIENVRTLVLAHAPSNPENGADDPDRAAPTGRRNLLLRAREAAASDSLALLNDSLDIPGGRDFTGAAENVGNAAENVGGFGAEN